MYTASKCQSNQLVTINRFNTTMGWENKTFYPDKYRNLHGCTLTAATSISAILVKGPNRPQGVLITDEFAKASNFKIAYVQFSQKLIDNNTIDLLALEDECHSKELFSHIFKLSSIVFYMPSGESYTQLEKMFMPF